MLSPPLQPLATRYSPRVESLICEWRCHLPPGSCDLGLHILKEYIMATTTAHVNWPSTNVENVLNEEAPLGLPVAISEN